MDRQALITLLADPKLSDRAKVMWVALNQQPNASAETLAQACGHCRRKAQLALGELIRHGLVAPRHQGRQVCYHLRAATGTPSALASEVPTGDPSHPEPVSESAQDPATRARFVADQGDQSAHDLSHNLRSVADQGVESAHDLTHSARFDADQGVESAHDLTHSARSCAHPAPIRARFVADPPSPNARGRTSSSSTSSIEEVLSPPPPPDEDPRKLAGSEAEDEFLACWQQLAKDCPAPSPAQLADLERRTTQGAPLTLARRFLQEGRSLSRLKQPAKAWVYFARACQNQTQPARASPRPATAPPADHQPLNLTDLHHQHPRSRP